MQKERERLCRNGWHFDHVSPFVHELEVKQDTLHPSFGPLNPFRRLRGPQLIKMLHILARRIIGSFRSCIVHGGDSRGVLDGSETREDSREMAVVCLNSSSTGV